MRWSGWERTPLVAQCVAKEIGDAEVDHIAGRKFEMRRSYSAVTVIRKKSDDQKDHPEGTSSPPNLFDRIGHFLLGLASVFGLFAEKCLEFGDALIEYAKTFAEQSQLQS